MWAIFASPLVITTPLLNCSKTDQINGNYTPGKCRASITDLQKEILFNSEIIGVNQDITPAGHLLQNGSSCTAMVYGRALSDGSQAVALYNPSDATVDASFCFTLFGWSSGTKAKVRDLWNYKDLGEFENCYPASGQRVTLEPHATTMLRIHTATTQDSLVI